MFGRIYANEEILQPKLSVLVGEVYTQYIIYYISASDYPHWSMFDNIVLFNMTNQ